MEYYCDNVVALWGESVEIGDDDGDDAGDEEDGL